MRIGIQVSSNLEKRTGVEEYIYQLLKHFPKVDDYGNHQFFLLNRESLKWPFKKGWTQFRLSWELLRNKLDVLFVPVHTPPLIHPKLVVVIQGLEYERVPEMYPNSQQKILRFLTKRNTKKAEKIIVPSECTKKDLIDLYRIKPEKIFVIPHGISEPLKFSDPIKLGKYILYLGSGHKRKNIDGIKKAFKILKEKHKIPHKLILAGVNKHVDENEKWQLLKNADVFVFPSFYEGFGFPVLEAQTAGIPVVASNVSSLPEVLLGSALLVDPENPREIAGAVYRIIKNPKLRQLLIKKGQENAERFSWLRCAEQTLKIITS